MTKHTARDYIWAAALELREEDEEELNPWGENRMVPLEFGAPKIEEALEEADPSARTIRDTLQTMRDLGELENVRTAGAAKPGAYRRPK